MSFVSVGKVDDFPVGEMREIEVAPERHVLVFNNEGRITATGHKCSHYGAPLVRGSFMNGSVRCPWHGACFNVETGDIEDFPGCESIPTYEVVVNEQDVSVKIEEEYTLKVTPPMVSKADDDERLFVIVGAGCAGGICAETLRQNGYTGRILVISKENNPPYDRTKLSKNLGADIDQILVRSAAFYENIQVELMLGTEVVELNPTTKTVKTNNGQEFVYDKCLVATGGDSQRLKFIPGWDGSNVYPLRTIEEANAINAAVEGKNVVLVGSSFIGMEVATAIQGKAASVTVMGMESVPFERVLGTEVGGILQACHEHRGVKFELGAVAQEFKQVDGVVTNIITKDGRDIPCDVVVLGAGVVPATDFIVEAEGLQKEKDRSIMVDEFLNSGCDGLYIAGDIARVPFIVDDHPVRIEHYGYAQTQGKIAGINMANEANVKSIKEHIPFFWTAQIGKSIRYAGHAFEYDEVLVDSANEIDNENPVFAAYYIRDGIALAICTLGRDPLAAEFSQKMKAGQFLTKEDILSTMSNL
eukprot:TRINITY_DN7945_c0_g1_i1.p1 TRINITY_DN7945_c0_g1~~TRINITY_DN7945_c0_g1_i1.p1  ORF type:complete len:529 (+),score=149.29 TRINITY_DN7945_c0_g1_i1:127-1713(+)